MQEDNKNEEKNEEIEPEEELQFGYGASAVFLVFIVFVIYFSLTR